MIPAELYEYIYIIVIAFLSFPVLKQYRRMDDSDYGINHAHFRNQEIWLVVILILFIGLRPVDKVFVDTLYYHDVIENRAIQFNGFDFDVENLLFDNVMYYFSYMHLDYQIFFIIISLIYFGGYYLVSKKLFPCDTYFAFLVFLSAFSTFSYSVNGIKAGAASSIFMLGLAYKEKRLLSILLVLLSWGIHHSMSFPIAVYIVVFFFNKPKYFFYFWILCLFMAIFHITTFQELFSNYADEKGAEYLMSSGEDWKGKGGLRLDLIIYSSMPVLLGWYATQKLKIKNEKYNFLLCYYLLSNAIWMLCMYVNYNNRIAYLSWFVYPFILIYPVLECEWKQSRYKDVAKYAKYHLLFTLFMVLIYYGLSTLI